MVFYFNRIFLKNWKNLLQKNPQLMKSLVQKDTSNFSSASWCISLVRICTCLHPWHPQGISFPHPHPDAPSSGTDTSSQVEEELLPLFLSWGSASTEHPSQGSFGYPSWSSPREQHPSVPSPSNYDRKFSSLASFWIGTTHCLYK